MSRSRWALDVVLLVGGAGVFALLLQVPGEPGWLAAELAGTRRVAGISVRGASGVRFTARVLGTEELVLEAGRASPLEPELGPLRVGGVWQGLELHDLAGQFPASGVRVRAGSARLDDTTLTLRDAVRLDEADGLGLLFAPRVELGAATGMLRAPGLAILAPAGTEGGMGGVAVVDFAATIEELRRSARDERAVR